MPAFGHPHRHLRTTESTNDVARALAASGAPSGTASKNIQPTTAEAAGPNAFMTKVETPPPPEKRAESSDIVSASGNVRSVIAPQATSEAGPASSAATAGITNTPEPSTAPA
jgi:hypothetical protein